MWVRYGTNKDMQNHVQSPSAVKTQNTYFWSIGIDVQRKIPRDDCEINRKITRIPWICITWLLTILSTDWQSALNWKFQLFTHQSFVFINVWNMWVFQHKLDEEAIRVITEKQSDWHLHIGQVLIKITFWTRFCSYQVVRSSAGVVGLARSSK